MMLKAGIEGFEPPNAGIRIQCLTAWRYPNIYLVRCSLASVALSDNSYYIRNEIILQVLFLFFFIFFNSLQFTGDLYAKHTRLACTLEALFAYNQAQTIT